MNNNLKVELTIAGWNLVLKALDKLEHGEVRMLFDEVQRQLQPQIKEIQEKQQAVQNAPLANKVAN